MAKENLAPLKILVWSGGVVLLGGFVFVAAMVMQKLGGGGAEACKPSKTLAMPVGGTIMGTQIEGRMLHVTISNASGATIASFDRCSGEVKGMTEIKVP